MKSVKFCSRMKVKLKKQTHPVPHRVQRFQKSMLNRFFVCPTVLSLQSKICCPQCQNHLSKPLPHLPQPMIPTHSKFVCCTARARTPHWIHSKYSCTIWKLTVEYFGVAWFLWFYRRRFVASDVHIEWIALHMNCMHLRFCCSFGAQ